jgi:signal transduction histidine kinase
MHDRAGALKIVVQDDGIGFDHSPEFNRVKPEGSFGLFSIKERMADLKGSFEIVSGPGKGCKAVLIAPLGVKT